MGSSGLPNGWDETMHGVQQLERKLSPREKDVLKGIVKGNTYAEIASSLGVAYDTVKTITNRLRAKTGQKSKTSLAVWAERNGVK